jgi:dipeptidyl aminopeptidase/acylaminoacyl peptidase
LSSATRTSLARLALILSLAPLFTGAAAQGKPTLTAADYGRFETVGATTLSPDGAWIAYAIQRVNDSSEVRLRPVARDTTRVIRWGQGALFSPDSRWLAWSFALPPAERAKLEKEKKPIHLRSGLLDLRNGAERSFDAVRAQSFDPTGRFLALHGYEPAAPKGKGADLRVLDLETGTELAFGNVAQFAWNDELPMLAFVSSSGGPAGNGVQLYDARSGRVVGLDAADASYRRLAWRDSSPDLLVLRSKRPAARSGGPQVLIAWRDVRRATPERIELDSGAFADSLMVSEHYAPRWSKDGARIALGLRPRDREEAARDSTATDDDVAGLQLWHASDVLVIPQQSVQAEARKQRTLLSTWHIAKDSVVQLGSALDEEATLLEGWAYALERADAGYPFGAMFGRGYHDAWVVNTATGERRAAFDSVRYTFASGAGRFVLSFDGKDYWTYELATGSRRNITKGVPAVFADTASDTPTDLLPPVGTGGWLDGDRAVLLYDAYDIWRVAPDGSGATRLTRGAEEGVVHRTMRVGLPRPTFAPSEPLHVSLHGLRDQKRGYARVMPSGAVQRLVFLDKYVIGLMKARSAPVYAYRAESRDDSPDWFVGGATLVDAQQVTATNPFMSQYAWGRTELVTYRNETGRELQGVLLYPAGHDPARKYPMIVYAYERLSQTAHLFQAPNERSYYSQTAWTQHGYFVLLPDIVFRARDPGVSLLETLRPAVEGVVARGLVDRARVGFAGHSWGGYHAAYVATHSEMFAAAVAGAPLTDFVSFMGQIHWTPGIPELDHWETGQARMQVPYWEDPEAHHRNSPIHNVQNMKTPLLMAFGNEDGVVDWDQGTEFYNFARRAGKQMVLLVYEGENHGFVRKPNQVDYHRRILEWFGHYLKGEPAPSWITRGVALDDIDAEKRRVSPPAKAVKPAEGAKPKDP